MKIPWKASLIGLATASVLAAVLAGALISRRASADQPGPAQSQGRAVATPVVFPHPGVWLDDAGGTVPIPEVTSVVPLCQPGDLSLSVQPERSSYNSAEIVPFLFDARFKGTQLCRVRSLCFPDVTVWDANGKEVWDVYGEVAGGTCAGTAPALLSKVTQHLRVTYHWRQDDCGLFCNETKRAQAAPAGQYTVTGSWRPFGTSPPSQVFTLQ